MISFSESFKTKLFSITGWATNFALPKLSFENLRKYSESAKLPFKALSYG